MQLLQTEIKQQLHANGFMNGKFESSGFETGTMVFAYELSNRAGIVHIQIIRSFHQQISPNFKYIEDKNVTFFGLGAVHLFYPRNQRGF
jgi:hypothetical protein